MATVLGEPHLFPIRGSLLRWNYFNRKPFRIQHSLGGHPLFELPRLLQLARALPERFVEYNAGALPVGVRPEETPRTGLSAEETIRRIQACGSWMVLKRVEQDPEYGAVLLDRTKQLAFGAAASLKRLWAPVVSGNTWSPTSGSSCRGSSA
ncbi:MAG TPA: hypothetical protein VF973_02440 [Myxococcales bacterium]